MKKALAPLGEDYTALLQEGFDNRWIDVYENEGSAPAPIHGALTERIRMFS